VFTAQTQVGSDVVVEIYDSRFKLKDGSFGGTHVVVFERDLACAYIFNLATDHYDSKGILEEYSKNKMPDMNNVLAYRLDERVFEARIFVAEICQTSKRYLSTSWEHVLGGGPQKESGERFLASINEDPMLAIKREPSETSRNLHREFGIVFIVRKHTRSRGY